MAKGGYQVISFAGFTGAEGEKVAGAYKKASTGKAILIEDYTIDDETISGFGVASKTNENEYSIFVTVGSGLLTIKISSDDTITIVMSAYTMNE